MARGISSSTAVAAIGRSSAANRSLETDQKAGQQANQKGRRGKTRTPPTAGPAPKKARKREEDKTGSSSSSSISVVSLAIHTRPKREGAGQRKKPEPPRVPPPKTGRKRDNTVAAMSPEALKKYKKRLAAKRLATKKKREEKEFPMLNRTRKRRYTGHRADQEYMKNVVRDDPFLYLACIGRRRLVHLCNRIDEADLEKLKKELEEEAEASREAEEALDALIDLVCPDEPRPVKESPTDGMDVCNDDDEKYFLGR